jgi:hypothetical protein
MDSGMMTFYSPHEIKSEYSITSNKFDFEIFIFGNFVIFTEISFEVIIKNISDVKRQMNHNHYYS